MKKILLFITPLILSLVILQITNSIAEEVKNSQLLKGMVEKIHADVITIKQDQPRLNMDASEIDVQVDEKTRYKNIDPITQLQKGDEVEIIYYKKEDGRNVAEEIVKILPEKVPPTVY